MAHFALETLVVTLTALWTLKGISSHNWVVTGIDSVLCAYWLRVTWKNLDRWTQPERKRVN